MRGLLVDPVARTIETVEVDGSIESIQNQVFPTPEAGRCVTIAYLSVFEPSIPATIEVDIWVDDEGLLKPNKLTKVQHYPTLLAGRMLMLCSDNEGECSEIPEHWIKSLISYVIFSDFEIG